MHVVLRADGGPDIGYGHLVRTSALGVECLSRGHRVTVATTTPESVDQICLERFDIETLERRGAPEEFTTWLSSADADIVFTDAYPIDAAYQRAIREQTKLGVLQDDARHAVCADLFINGNIYAAELNYDFRPPEPECYLGPKYVLLREAIRSRISAEPPWRERAEQAIITMGGSDIANLTPAVLQGFDDLEIDVEVIVGPGFSDNQEREIRTVGANISSDVTTHRDPDDLVARFFQADIAVSTASTTTYEFLALGTPMVSIPVVKNQRPIANALRNRDVATVVEPPLAIHGIKKAVKTYLTDSSLRRRRREAGRELVDGRGVERVTDKLLSLIE